MVSDDVNRVLTRKEIRAVYGMIDGHVQYSIL